MLFSGLLHWSPGWSTKGVRMDGKLLALVLLSKPDFLSNILSTSSSHLASGRNSHMSRSLLDHQPSIIRKREVSLHCSGPLLMLLQCSLIAEDTRLAPIHVGTKNACMFWFCRQGSFLIRCYWRRWCVADKRTSCSDSLPENLEAAKPAVI